MGVHDWLHGGGGQILFTISLSPVIFYVFYCILKDFFFIIIVEGPLYSNRLRRKNVREKESRPFFLLLAVLRESETFEGNAVVFLA